LTTDILIVRALERGITLADFEVLTIGMIMDLIITFNNDNYEDTTEENVRMATQADFDRW